MSGVLGTTDCIVKALTGKRLMQSREAAWGRRRQFTVALSSQMAYIGPSTSQCAQRTITSFQPLHFASDLITADGMMAC